MCDVTIAAVELLPIRHVYHFFSPWKSNASNIFSQQDEREQRVDKAKRGTLYPRKMKHSMIQVVKPVGPSSPFFRSTLVRMSYVCRKI